MESFNVIEVKEVNLDREIRRYRMRNPIIQHKEESLYDYMTNVAKHFFELGLKAQKGKSFIDTLETKEEDKEETKWFPSKKQMECLKDIYD